MISTIFLFFNGIIITVNENFSIYNAFAILNEKILYVGSEKQIRNLIDKNYKNLKVKRIDLKGKTVVPGFIDSHMHPIISVYFKTQLQLTDVKSFSELNNAFKREISSKSEDFWILGLDFLEERFTDPTERQFPRRNDLDEISTTHPIIVLRHDGHSCCTNSRGLEILNINKNSVSEFVLESGRIETDDNGEPTGVFTENATSILLDQVPTPNFENFIEAGIAFSHEMASLGITSIGAVIQTSEEGPSGSLGSLEFPIIQILIKESALFQDYVLYLITDKPKKLLRYTKTMEKLDKDTNQFVVGGIKRFLDGVIGARTAYLSEPFSDGPPKNYGFLVSNKNALLDQFTLAYKMGYDLICHAIGDKAIQELVKMYKSIKENVKYSEKLPIMRIEHASILTESLLREIKENNIFIASQPAFIESEHFWLKSRLGEDRCNLTYPFKSIFDSGIMLAGASDAPVENPDVLNAIGVAIHRFGFVPEEKLSVEEALRMFTINAATALGQELNKGSIEIGKYADFVILDENILKIAPKDIKKIKVLETYRRGKKIYPINTTGA
ncbi:MAG: amidohydrolase [Candidatus Lokiarchaeota archaeon]|nr:amidohydrolase [Candidatus Lokiarchaeota archaeon]